MSIHLFFKGAGSWDVFFVDGVLMFHNLKMSCFLQGQPRFIQGQTVQDFHSVCTCQCVQFVVGRKGELNSQMLHVWSSYLRLGLQFMVNVGKYSIDGAYEIVLSKKTWVTHVEGLKLQGHRWERVFGRVRSLPSWELTYPLPAGTFEDYGSFPIWWDMLVSGRLS